MYNVENGQTYIKNLAVFTSRHLSMFDHFSTLCMKWIKVSVPIIKIL